MTVVVLGEVSMCTVMVFCVVDLRRVAAVLCARARNELGICIPDVICVCVIL